MLKLSGRCTVQSWPPILPLFVEKFVCVSTCSATRDLKRNNVRVLRLQCAAARRRVRFEEDEEESDYGYNEEISMVEVYSQSAREEALLVHAMVDDEEVEVLVFKGFSSSLNYRTSSDPSKSILPTKAVMKSIDRIRGPFDPSNIEYIEKDIRWEVFKSRLLQA